MTGRASIQGRLKGTDERAVVDRLWVYACAHCRKFHLTKVENNGAAITADEMYEGTGM